MSQCDGQAFSFPVSPVIVADGISKKRIIDHVVLLVWIITKVITELALFRRPLKVVSLGSSAWAQRYRIDVEAQEHTDSYFMKISFGDHGREALKGEFESTLAIHSIVGSFTPRPIKWGSIKALSGAHYYLCRFYDFAEHAPKPAEFCQNIAFLHSRSDSPSGKFGFHLVTYNGDLPQENGYIDTWEEFFPIGFRHMVNMNIERGGPWPELEGLDTAMIDKVIPRLLRPMETGGRSIKPSLVHGDLWCGNVAVDSATGRPLIYDPASFYAHNEYELGNWRPERNGFDRSFFDAYHSIIPKTAPTEDYNDRIALYSLRFNLQAAALFPEDASFRNSVIEEMRHLVAKYPGGYEEYARMLSVGLGTFQSDDGNGNVKQGVLQALRFGYRHTDTAIAYGNEREVGEVIKKSEISLEEIIITTKLALDLSLERLQLDYVDFYLMHYTTEFLTGYNTIRHPHEKVLSLDHELSRDYPSTWTAMEILLKRLVESSRIPPAVNQIELHPPATYVPQVELVDFCKINSIHVAARQPLGGKPVAAVNQIAKIAAKNGLSPAQTILSWIVQQDISVTPKTVQESRMVENLDLTQLPDEDMSRMSHISKKKGEVRYLDPKHHVDFDIFDEQHDQPVQE
ncbi:Aldo/keto reductase [Aspergillus neoniger CBS 115656]|uniref:protein-ribulosamine 3-kinase n=1 Tax=Aspergillus neoniger (strain CBS 115656) TaxID=1448310 RepID=A0A318Z4J7_ASPNB|nr:Aldo/keto reductase [Aspergillus neoniger CBS 115656]PYH31862.1 Aldo/keto reductase [Aspergillus neoniger CBS 115656]